MARQLTIFTPKDLEEMALDWLRSRGFEAFPGQEPRWDLSMDRETFETMGILSIPTNLPAPIIQPEPQTPIITTSVKTGGGSKAPKKKKAATDGNTMVETHTQHEQADPSVQVKKEDVEQPQPDQEVVASPELPFQSDGLPGWKMQNGTQVYAPAILH